MVRNEIPILPQHQIEPSSFKSNPWWKCSRIDKYPVLRMWAVQSNNHECPCWLVCCSSKVGGIRMLCSHLSITWCSAPCFFTCAPPIHQSMVHKPPSHCMLQLCAFTHTLTQLCAIIVSSISSSIYLYLSDALLLSCSWELPDAPELTITIISWYILLCGKTIVRIPVFYWGIHFFLPGFSLCIQLMCLYMVLDLVLLHLAAIWFHDWLCTYNLCSYTCSSWFGYSSLWLPFNSITGCICIYNLYIYTYGSWFGYSSLWLPFNFTTGCIYTTYMVILLDLVILHFGCLSFHHWLYICNLYVYTCGSYL